ncbi:glyoxylate/hydroxypyruvate reductase A [Aurantibacter crassamenti]|uniref:2-hydroxyacid dehydrogenase n=1 Tax=Aurantibacter crassamenti TaxID=1837375 RepID=UPI001939D299|nr:glyoxylate/hydroxypyruvate reductase A [Aurantibacter crassamenti]MBM1107097.1 glyoxylate/hydroxypyruvate reductase A [Aurantibacter crassamenti]
MAIVIIRQDNKEQLWKDALLAADSKLAVYTYKEEYNPDDIDMALIWKHPEGSLAEFPNLKCIASNGAGVDYIFEDDKAPTHLPITRVVDKFLAADMSEHVLALILAYLKNIEHYKVDQFNKIWKPIQYKRIADFKIGILGFGTLGQVLATDLIKFGFNVQGWSNSRKSLDKVQSFAGQDELSEFLATTEVLVCLLPLTEETAGILNKELFQQLPKNAYIINVARGGHLVDADLIEMLDNGHLSGASLDVYHQEPLSTDHPFWEHPKVHMTPHYASVSDTNSVIPQILENYRRLQNNEPLLNLVSKTKGY